MAEFDIVIAPLLTVTVPDAGLLASLQTANQTEWAGRVNLVPWAISSPPPAAAWDAELAIVGHYWNGKYDLNYLSQLPKLRAVQLPSAGFEHALPYLPAGVALANGRGVHSAETAELAVGLIIAMQRGIHVARDMQSSGYWAPTAETHVFKSLADRRVLVIGAGSVAMALARRLVPFEIELTMVGRTARFDAELEDLGVNSNPNVHAISELPQLLPQAEIAVLVVPSDTSTYHLIGAAELALMADGALLVNVARGPVVDTDALVAELQSGRLRAALDVTDPEPLPPHHPLWTAPNTLITPHVGGNTSAADIRFAELVQLQISHLLNQEPLENLVEV